jgi:hypothetical protein
MSDSKKCLGLKVISFIAIAFGLLTLKSGGEVLFIDGAGRAAAGNYVPYVLWSNFLLGFLYIVAGIGLWMQKRWAAWLAVFIALTTLAVFAAFGWHINSGGLYEARTMKAMVLRSGLWVIFSVVAYWRLVISDYAR